jgi:methionyl-tRNA formyltransferase
MSQEEFSTINNQLSISEALKPAPKIFKETCEVNWCQPAKRVYDFVRGLSPYPGAWTTLVAPDGKETVLKLFKTTKTALSATEPGRIRTDKHHLYVSCADMLLQIDELQLAGKKRMDAAAFCNGMKDIENYFVR